MSTKCTIITTEPNKARLALGTTEQDGTVTPSEHFMAGLSADGNEPATHFISSGIWEQEELDILDNSGIEMTKVYDSDPQTVIEEAGLKIVSVEQEAV